MGAPGAATAAIVNALVERLASAFLAFDRELRVEFASPELADILGGVVRGRPLEGSDAHVTAIVDLVARVRESGEPIFHGELGAELVASAYPIRIDGEVVGVGCVLENARRDRATTDLLDATGLPIAVFDGPEHRVRAINRPWRDRVGLAGSTGMRARDFLSDDLVAILDRVYATRNSEPVDRPMLGFHGIAAPVRTAIGAVRGAMLVSTDSEDDRRTETRARDQFLASLSHELRAPITTLLLWEKVLRDAHDDADLRTRALDAIHQSATTQARLVDDLLDVARAISGKLRVDLQALDIASALSAAIDDEVPFAHAKHQHLERDIHPNLGLVSADLSRLRQILRNLLANAIKFTGDGGTIRVSARTDQRRVLIEVSDSGQGIAREFLDHIFEPFSQAEDSRSPTGLGLGLAISYQLAVAHGGQLSASSFGLGLGSTFTLSLPVTTHRAATPVPVGPTTRLSGMHVLVVDDDRRVLDALQVLLQCAGATVEVADSAESGFGAIRSTAPDIVLSDLAMPDEDGYSLVRRIRNLTGPAGRVPTVAVTGHATAADRERALAAGFDLYLTKPVDVDHLIATIVQLVTAGRE